MLLRSLFIAALVASLCGCEKGRELLRGASSRGAGLADVQPGGEPDESLGAKILREEGGVRFRRDLPFPRECAVRVVEVTQYDNVRTVTTSALTDEPEMAVMKGRSERKYLFNKTPGRFGIKIETSRLIPKVEVNGRWKDGDSVQESDLEGSTVIFSLTKEGWRPRSDGAPVDFKQVVWADSLAGSVNAQMVEAGVYPRAQWFSSTRAWHKGDAIVLTGSALKILDAGNASGRVTLVFEGEEAVGGHPCGVFSVSGDLMNPEVVMPDGSRQDIKYSITAGKIWASLLHPVVLREEHEAIFTAVSRQGSDKDAPMVKLQGPIKRVKALAWQPG